MKQLSYITSSKLTKSRGNASHRLAGIFLFVSVFTVTKVQADELPELHSSDIRQQVFNKYKDPELVAFYVQVFGAEELGNKASVPATVKKRKASRKDSSRPKLLAAEPKPLKVVVPKKKSLSTAIRLQYLIDDLNKSDSTIINNKRKSVKRTLLIGKKDDSPLSKKHHNKKDLDLVAFYEEVFGKVEKDIPLGKTSIKRDSKEIVHSNNIHRTVSKSKPFSTNKTVISDTVEKESITATTENKLQALIDDLSQSSKSKQNNKASESKEVPAKIKAMEPKDESHIEPAQLISTTKKVTSENKSSAVEVENKPKEELLQELIDSVKNGTTTNTKSSRELIPSISQDTDTSVLSSQTPEQNKTTSSSSKAADINALFAKAFGTKAIKNVPSNISVELKINKTILGDVTLYSNKQGDFDKADAKVLFMLLKNVLKEHVFKRIEKSTSKKEKVSLESLKQFGIRLSYNPNDISLELAINSELRKPLVLSMQTQKKTSVRDENKIMADKVSMYLNMYSNTDFTSGDSKPQSKMKLEGSLNVNDFVLESTINVRGGQFSTDKAVLTYDKPDKLLRFSVGNISTGNTNFQENLRLDGFRLSKEFFLDPELQIRPRANESFILESDSEVEVYINNLLRQRFYLRAGIYSLEDIGLYDGANNIRILIKDEFGKITEKNSQQYFDSHLLKKGLSMYAISVGYLSSQQSGENNKLITDPVISAYYQEGLAKNLTMSADAQVSQNSYLLGSEIITSIPLGSIKNSWAISGGKSKDSGMATRFEFRPNRQPEKISLDTLRRDMLGLDETIGGFFKSWTLSGEFRSKDFSLLNGSDTFDIEKNEDKKRLKARLQTNFSLNISDNWRGVFNLGVYDYYNANNNFSANLTATRRFNNGINLSLGARYDSDDDYSVNLQLSIPLFREKGRRKKSLSLLADSKNNSLETKLNVRPTSLIGKNSLGGSLEYIQDESSRQQNLDLSYRNHNFETKLTARNRFTKDNNEMSQQLSLGFNSSLACVGGSCATSFPIEDSFALVSGPSNQITPIAINEGINRFKYSDDNNSGLPDNYTALIKNKKSKAVVRLESYRYQNINIDESTLPDGYDTEKTEFEVFPRYHQGFVIKAGGEPATLLNGILLNEEKKPLGYKGGQWVPADKEGKAIAFFSNKAGRFRITSIPAGKYKLELFDYPDMQAINVEVPDLKGEVYDAGSLLIIE